MRAGDSQSTGQRAGHAAGDPARPPALCSSACSPAGHPRGPRPTAPCPRVSLNRPRAAGSPPHHAGGQPARAAGRAAAGSAGGGARRRPPAAHRCAAPQPCGSAEAVQGDGGQVGKPVCIVDRVPTVCICSVPGPAMTGRASGNPGPAMHASLLSATPGLSTCVERRKALPWENAVTAEEAVKVLGAWCPPVWAPAGCASVGMGAEQLGRTSYAPVASSRPTFQNPTQRMLGPLMPH